MLASDITRAGRVKHTDADVVADTNANPTPFLLQVIGASVIGIDHPRVSLAISRQGLLAMSLLTE